MMNNTLDEVAGVGRSPNFCREQRGRPVAARAGGILRRTFIWLVRTWEMSVVPPPTRRPTEIKAVSRHPTLVFPRAFGRRLPPPLPDVEEPPVVGALGQVRVDFLVVDRSPVKPVSDALDSLLTGKITGNFSLFEGFEQHRDPENTT